MTPQELRLWFYLKGNNLGVRFRRQQGIGPYIADFYCKEKNLVIELDGLPHMEAREYDQERDNYIKSLNIKVLRFWNNKVDKNIEGVLMKIKNHLLLS